MSKRILLESLSGIHFSAERPEKVVEVVEELIAAQIAREVRLVMDRYETASDSKETVSQRGSTPVNQPENRKKTVRTTSVRLSPTNS